MIGSSSIAFINQYHGLALMHIVETNLIELPSIV